MKRRNFLSCLPFLAPAVMAVALRKEPDEFEWKGYRIRWNEYVRDIYSDRMIGYWMARNLAITNEYRPHVLSCTMGVVSRVSEGDAFNSEWHQDRRKFIHLGSSQEDRDEVKVQTLAALKQFILDEEKPKPEPEYTFKFSGFRPAVGGSYDTACGDFDPFQPEIVGAYDPHPLLTYAKKHRA